MTLPIFKDGVAVRVNFKGEHEGKEGTVSRIVTRSMRPDLVYVSVPGVDRDLVYYPSDLELVR